MYVQYVLMDSQLYELYKQRNELEKQRSILNRQIFHKEREMSLRKHCKDNPQIYKLAKTIPLNKPIDNSTKVVKTMIRICDPEYCNIPDFDELIHFTEYFENGQRISMESLRTSTKSGSTLTNPNYVENGNFHRPFEGIIHDHIYRVQLNFKQDHEQYKCKFGYDNGWEIPVEIFFEWDET